MKSISEYQDIAEIYSGQKNIIFRAKEPESGRQVILKVFNQRSPTTQELLRFRREYHILRSIAIPGVIKTYQWTDFDERPCIVMEDIGGSRLDQARSLPIPAEVFFPLAIQLAETVGNLHQAGIMHRSINPGNIVWQVEQGLSRLIDFGQAVRQLQTQRAPRRGHTQRGALAYMPPEQTEWTCQVMDYRVDIYALGASFYEMLTGSPPFYGVDPHSMLRAQMNPSPRPPSQVQPAIPKALCQLVLKMIAPKPHLRYQNAFSVMEDLQKCYDAMLAGRSDSNLELKNGDSPLCLSPPEHLYGRDLEWGQLTAAYARVALGACELVVLTGYPGIGKTALAHSMLQQVRKKKSFWACGKCDQVHTTHPYRALAEALNSFFQQICEEGSVNIALWRERLLKKLGGLAAIMADLIPALGDIVGSLREPPQLPPQAAKNRFRYAFTRLLEAITDEDQVFVLFLDHVQWADHASMDLLANCIAEGRLSRILFLFACRDLNQVEGHPFRKAMSFLQTTGIHYKFIHLTPIARQHVEQLLADTFCRARPTMSALAEIIVTKTGGNPFSIQLFLQQLQNTGLINFDPYTHQWHWDMEAIAKHPISQKIGDLIATKFRTLTNEARAFLNISLCMGHQIALPLLTKAMNVTPLELLQPMRELLLHGFMVTTQGDPRLLDPDAFPLEDMESTDVSHLEVLIADYCFSMTHDRFHQAAFSALPEHIKTKAFASLGTSLFRLEIEKPTSAGLFEKVNYFNGATQATQDASPNIDLVHLNLLAGQRALDWSANAEALDFFAKGIDLLPVDAWDTSYGLTLTAYLQAAEAAALQSDPGPMLTLTQIALSYAKSTKDRVAIYQCQIRAHIAHQRFSDALTATRSALKLLGVPIPIHPTKWTQALTVFQLLFSQPATRTAPPTLITDNDRQAALELLVNLIYPCYHEQPKLLPILTLRALQTLKKLGQPALAAPFLAIHAAISARFHRIAKALSLSDIALHLLSGDKARGLEAKTRLIAVDYVRHWKLPITDSITVLKAGFKSGLETGDLEFAGYCAYLRTALLFYKGESLEKIAPIIAHNHQFATSNQLNALCFFFSIFHQAVVNLRMEEVDCPWDLTGKNYNELLSGRTHFESKEERALLLQVKILISCIFSNFEHAESLMRESFILENHFRYRSTGPFCYLHMALFALNSATHQPESQRYFLKAANRCRQRLLPWQTHAPQTVNLAIALIDAITFGLQGKENKALAHFRQSLHYASEGHNPLAQALANEFAGKYYLQLGDPRIASLFLEDAHHAYRQWGALAKIRTMKIQYGGIAPGLFIHELPGED